MALAPSAGVLSNPARTSTSSKTCHNPIQPSSSYGTLHHPGRLHSSLTSRAICNAAARFGTNSWCSMHDSKAAGQTAHASGVVRPLQLSPPAGAHVASHSCKRRASTCVSCSNSSSDSLPYEHSPRPISPVPRSQSPFTTAEPVQLPTTSPTSSLMSTEQQHSQSGNTSMPPAAASAVLPSVDLSPSDTAQIAAAAEAQAAVTANLSVSGMCGQHLSSSSATTQEAKLQDLLTFLRLQVRVDQNNEAAMHTLLQLVKSAAINQLPISSLMAPSNLKLWQRLLTAEPPVAVLAAEVLCRVCNQDLQPWTQQLTTIIPILLTVVENRGVGDAGSQTPASDDPEVAGSAPGDSKSTPLVFFAISALVRMSAVEALAVEIVKQGGVQQLIAALAVTNAAVRQVTTFALFRLMREVDGDLSDDELMHWPNSSIDSSNDSSSSSSATVIDNGKDQASSRQLLLVQYVRHGAFPKLCSVLSDSGGGSAHELAVSMLLSMSIIPEVSRLVADKNEVRDIVKVLSETNSGGTRLEAMLITARLCARHTPCQQDAVREGAVPVLVQVMNDSSSTDEERCHAARLLAILGQHASTHQIMLESGALSAAIRIIQDRGHQRVMYNNILAARLDNIETSDKKPLELWEAAQAIYNAAIAVGLSGPAASSAAAAGVAAAVVESGERAEQHKVTVQQQLKKLSDVQQQQQSQQRRVSAGGSSGGSGTESHSSSSSSSISSSINSSTPIGPALVLEQAAGVVCMLSHNLDNHFKMVGEGVVPLLVSLINKGTLSKTLSYCLASLLMFAVSEPRHAAVVARTGAVPCLVELVGTSAATVTVSNREMSAALLAVLCRSPDVADEVVAAGGIQALVRLLGDDVSSGRCYACEALSQLAACSALRCQQVMRAQVMTPLKIMISNSTGSSSGSSSVSSQSLMWSSRLLQVLAGDPGSLRELCRTPGLVAMIPDILRKQTVLPAAATAAGPVATDTGSSSSSGSGRVLPSSVFSSAASIPDIPVAGVWNSFSSRDGVSDSGDDTEMTTLAAAAAVDPGLWRDADLEKAQSNLCWVIAALATDAITRPVVIALGCDLVKPLVIILRDSQAGQGSGYSLSEVLEGITHSRQAAAAAALRALSRCDDQLAAAINAELTVQMWLGYRVELPVVDGDFWPFAPGWYLKG